MSLKARAVALLPVLMFQSGCGGKLDPVQSLAEAPPPAQVGATTPCWERDIQPLMTARCHVCHGPNQPYDFSSWDHVRLSLEAIRLKVRSDQMPPDDPLDTAQRRALLQWVDSGGPRCAP